MGILMNETELPSEELTVFYHYFEYVMLVITVFIVGYTLAVMSMTSWKGLSRYKWYLIHGIVLGFGFDTMATFIGAVSLYPMPCYYGINLASLIGGNAQLVYFFVGFNCAMGKILAVFMQFEHRFQQALPLDSWYRTNLGVLHGKYEVHIRAAIYGVAGITINAPLVSSSPDQHEQQLLLTNLDPVLGRIYRDHPNTICFSSGTESWVVRVTLVWLVFVVVVQIILLAFINTSIHRLKVSLTTYRLQMMLFWSLVAQMAALFVFIIAPGLVILGGAALGIRNMPKIGVVCFCFFISHTTVDSLLVLFFIKPYRRVVLHNFGSVWNKMRNTETTSVVTSSSDVKIVY